MPNGREILEYYIVERQDSAICVCQIDGQVLLVRQYRPGIGKTTLCHPGGRIEKDDQSPVQGALRELLEETGLTPTKAQPLGAFAQIPAVETGRVYIFFVIYRGLNKATPMLDHTEDLHAELVPIFKLKNIISSGNMVA